MIENELQLGIQAVKNGELEKARIYLAQVVRNNPKSEDGWLWFGHSLVDTEKRIFCYRKVLSINSQNADARQKLDELTQLYIPNLPRKDDISDEGKSTDRADNFNNGGKKKQDSSSDQKKGALMIAGLLMGMILIGLPLIFFILTGKFDSHLNIVPTSNPTLAPTLTNTILPTSSHTPSLTSSPTITELTSLTFTMTPIPGPSVGSYILEAKNHITKKEYADALLKLNEAIKKYPTEAELYYLRASCYYGLLANQRSESEYSDYLSSAYSDMEAAIAIRADIGDYFAFRQSLLFDLMGLATYRVDQRWLSDLAAQNELMAIALGSTILDDPERAYIVDLLYANKCDEGLQKVNDLLGKINGADTSINGLYTIQAIAFACLGQNDKALIAINKALVTNPDDAGRRGMKAKYLYLVGKKSESLTLLNDLIEKAPSYYGDRYYLRALIYYEMGMRDKAEQDLLNGSGNTWSRAGIYPYVLGKMALADGKLNEGISLLQEAEATFFTTDTTLRSRVQNELAQLGAPTLVVTPSILANATAIATIQPRPTARPFLTPSATLSYVGKTPTANPQSGVSYPPMLNTAINVDLESGSGAINLKPGDYPLFRFQPAQPILVKSVKSLLIRLVSAENNPGFLNLNVMPWSPYDGGGWRTVDARWGETPVEYPSLIVGPEGDVIIAIKNWGIADIKIAQFSLILTVETQDGAIRVYGSR